MDFTPIQTLIASILGIATTAILIGKHYGEIGSQRSAKKKESYALQKELSEVCANATDSPGSNYVIESVYRNVYPNSKMDAPEIKHIMGFMRATSALERFNKGHPFLAHVSQGEDGKPRILFKADHASATRRSNQKWWCFALYVLCCVLAFAPWLFVGAILERFPPLISVLLATLTLSSIWNAINALKHGARIRDAEKFMEIQDAELQEREANRLANPSSARTKPFESPATPEDYAH